MRRLVAVVLILAVVITATAITPRRAQATDNLVYIIPAAISGVIIVALVIAILVADHSKEPDLDLAERIEPRQSMAPVHFGPACRRASGEMPLLCW